MNTDYAAWRDRLAQANDPAFWPIEAIDAELGANRAQFWCDGTSALVTRIVEYPGGAKVLEGLAASGTLESIWGQIVPQLEAYARLHGIKRLHAMGRPGWSRAHPQGWEEYMTVIVKDIA